MGIDINCNFGIGFEIKIENNDVLDELEGLVHNTDFKIFKVGDEYEVESLNTPIRFFISIKSPFENGIGGLEKKINNLNEFLVKNNINWIGSFGLYGGEYVY